MERIRTGTTTSPILCDYYIKPYAFCFFTQVNSSIAYPGSGQNILSPNNVTIVIALAVCSVIVIVVLIVAIALMRSRDKRKKAQRAHQYQLNIQRSLPSAAEVEGLSGHDLDRSSLRSSNASHSHGKDSGFSSDIAHNMHGHNNGVTYVNKQYDKVRFFTSLNSRLSV